MSQADKYTVPDMPKHGSPADRGGADAYYRRPRAPHYYPNGTYVDPRIDAKDMTPEEIAAYNEAFDLQDDFKDWGDWYMGIVDQYINLISAVLYHAKDADEAQEIIDEMKQTEGYERLMELMRRELN